MSDATISIESRDDYRIIRLDRPDKLNALTRSMLTDLRAAFEAAERDGCRAVLLTGQGKAFCVGQDLAEVDPARSDGPPALGETLETFYNPMVRALRAIRAPVVCSVNGVAAGAGANIALACDIVIAARSAKFIQAFDKIGLVPDSGGTWTLARQLGLPRALGWALTGVPLKAEKAAEWGLIWKVVDDDQLPQEAEQLVAALGAGPTVGFALTKEAMRTALLQDMNAQLDLERDLQQRAGRSPDYAEGVGAFMAKRAPNFTGQSETSTGAGHAAADKE